MGAMTRKEIKYHARQIAIMRGWEPEEKGYSEKERSYYMSVDAMFKHNEYPENRFSAKSKHFKQKIELSKFQNFVPKFDGKH